MTKQSRPVLKGYFNTNDIPTEAQYSNVLDSYPNLVSEAISFKLDDTIVAFNGGGQANATVLTEGFIEITIVVAPNDSVKFPTPGTVNLFFVKNDTSNSANLFPHTNGVINNQAINTAIAIPGNSNCICFYTGNNKWAVSVI